MFFALSNCFAISCVERPKYNIYNYIFITFLFVEIYISSGLVVFLVIYIFICSFYIFIYLYIFCVCPAIDGCFARYSCFNKALYVYFGCLFFEHGSICAQVLVIILYSRVGTFCA